jgi:hypothetical protein
MRVSNAVRPRCSRNIESRVDAMLPRGLGQIPGSVVPAPNGVLVITKMFLGAL